MIERNGYERKGYYRTQAYGPDRKKHKKVWIEATYVPPTKIKDRGAKGKGKKLIDMKDFRHLTNFGYTFEKDAIHRRKALEKAVKKYGKGWAVHRLNAIKNLQHTTEPHIARKAEQDINWIHTTF